MKLTNTSRIYDINTFVMRGTISMTQEEWGKAYIFLKKRYSKAKKNCETYTRDSLYNIIKEEPKDKVFNIGIYATRLIVEKYGLKNYKDVNYGIRIKQ